MQHTHASTVQVFGEPGTGLLLAICPLTPCWPKLRTAPNIRLIAGDRVGSLKVVSTPGHTPGHVAFLDTRDGSLIAGDTVTAIGRVAVASQFYLRFPLAAMAGWDKTRVVESAQRLRSLDPTMLVVGHSPAVRDPGPAMDRAIAEARARQRRHERRLEEAHERTMYMSRR